MWSCVLKLCPVQHCSISCVLNCHVFYSVCDRNAPAVGEATVPLTDQFYGVEPNTVLQMVTVQGC